MHQYQERNSMNCNNNNKKERNIKLNNFKTPQTKGGFEETNLN